MNDRNNASLEIAPNANRPAVLASLMLVVGLAALDQNIVTTALPRISAELGGADQLSWIVSAFLLTSTISTPLYGKFADMAGRRRTLITALVLFLIGSAACGIAQNMGQLILFRALQGLGAGGLMTLSFIVVSDIVSPVDRPRYQGLFTAAFTVSSAAGPLIGGALTTALSWRWAFYVNIPLGGIALMLIAINLRAKQAVRHHAIDYPGVVFLALATTAFMSLLTWGSPTTGRWPLTIILLLCCLLATLAFFRQEARAAEPILSLDLFTNRTFALMAALTACVTIPLMGITVFIPVYLQVVLGQTPLQAGLVIVPQLAGVLLSSVIGGNVASRVGRIRPFLLAGVSLGAFSAWALAAAVWFDARPVAVAGILFGFGAGMGLVMPNLALVVQNAFDHRRRGEATGAITFVRTLGTAIGVALTGGIVTGVLTAKLGPLAATHAAHMQDLLDHGRHGFAALAGEAAALLATYRLAIAVSFAAGAAIMTCAIGIGTRLPDQRLSDDRQPGETTEL